MIINYDVTGKERKKLIAVISQELNETAKYLGTPTFAFEVGGYHIDINGVVNGEDNHDLVAYLQSLHDFKPVSEEYDTPPLSDEPTLEGVSIPYEAALGGRISPYRDYGEPSAYGIPETDSFIIEMPLTGFTTEKLNNLTKLVNAKTALLKIALGVDSLPIYKTEDTIRFPWFSGELDSDTLKIYSILIEKICSTAKEKKRITAKERKVCDNPKYAMRCWLLSLGFIGDEYKQARKILLSNLSGNSSWKNNRKSEETANGISE